MKEAKHFYVVRFWVAPEGRDGLLSWIKNGHVQEVVDYPGFLWCRHLVLDEKDDKGWEAHSMIYGIESKEAFDKYAADKELPVKFAKQRESFAKYMRIERFDAELLDSYEHK